MDGPIVDPQDPFSRLVADHRRIEEELSRLDQVSGTRLAAASVADADVPAVIRGVLEFFAGQGARHHENEERSLFPRLRGLPAFAMMIPAIEAQHQMMDTDYAALLAEVDRGAPAALRKLAGRFAEMHRGHIIAEERGLFPLAMTALPPSAKAEIAREMSDRSP